MNNFILIVVFSFFSLNLFANEVPSVSPDFRYEKQSHPILDKSRDRSLKEIDQYFERQELSRIFINQPMADQKTSLEAMDRIYSGDLGQTVVFVKTGVKPNLPRLMNEVVSIEDGHLAHFMDQSGLVIAVYIKSAHWETVSDIFQDLKSNYQKVVHRKNIFEFISSSIAEEDCTNCTAKVQDGVNVDIKELEEKVAPKASPIQYLTGCTTKALKGVWEGSGGVVVGGVKTIGKFITSPIESGKKFWQSASKLWDVTKQFFSDFQNEARKLYDSFDSLDPLTKTELACEVIGTVGGGVLLSYLTAGVMSAAATKTALLRIQTALKNALNTKKFAGAKKALATNSAKLTKLDDVNRDLFSIPRGKPAEAVLKNDLVLKNLEEVKITPASTAKKPGLESHEINKLFRKVNDNPVASLMKVDDYSVNTPGMGYCFGRATTAHIKAIGSGLDKNSVRKVWALGELKTGSTTWRYHVTTIVRDSQGKWHAIDPIFGRPMSVEQWYKEMKKFDSKGDMRIFDTPANRFGPSSPAKYSPHVLKDKVYENYFTDLMKSFREEALRVRLQTNAGMVVAP
jgi:hypothetical protein